jgi:uncharacterized RDD family membrane protein YckC
MNNPYLSPQSNVDSNPDIGFAFYPLATRWPRFFARIIDIWLEKSLVTFVVAYVLSIYLAGFIEWINAPGAEYIFGIICLPVALIVDAFIYKVFGNTIGKRLLGLKVTTLDGKPLSLIQYMHRNLSVLISGLAFGLPFINLFTLGRQFYRLREGRQASYDEATGFRVRSKPS